MGSILVCLDSENEVKRDSIGSLLFLLLADAMLSQIHSPPESAQSCLMAAKTFIGISIYMIIVIVFGVVVSKRYQDQVDAIFQQSTEDQGTAIEMAGDL